MTPLLTDEMVAGMDDMSEDAVREKHIAECGRQVNAAYARSDHTAARQWLDLQTQAVKARSPVQVAAMERDYFSEEGERARLAARTGGIPHA